MFRRVKESVSEFTALLVLCIFLLPAFLPGKGRKG